MTGKAVDPRSRTPRTDTVLNTPELQLLQTKLGLSVVKKLVREALDECRQGLLDPDLAVAAVVDRAPETATSMRRVINATGVLVHTNLGRAPLSQAAIRAAEFAAGSVDVELDLATGERGSRGANVTRALLDRVPLAGAAHVVNNGAAALALIGAALGSRREVIIARGELVEIGDRFRIPDLLTSAGALIREVGATNRVHLDDYVGALSSETALVLKVHPSNFVVSGFTSSVEVADLASIGVPVVYDIGSGLLAPHPRLPNEPDAFTALAAGADVVVASGDKLLGGPQCGLILSRDPALLERIKRHPLARALRVDKLRLAALEATLRGPEPPVLRQLAVSVTSLRRRATAIAEQIGHDSFVVETKARVGGGGAPEVELASVAISLAAELESPLRTCRRPILGRLQDGRLLLDLFAVAEQEDAVIAEIVNAAYER